MSEEKIDSVPAGFTVLPTGLGFTDNLQPCYRRVEGETVSFGLIVGLQHGNSMGICHGGVLMTLADVAAANGVSTARGVRAASPTINLSLDFISAGRIGQWIQADVQLVTVKRRFGFCSGVIVAGDTVIARFNGTFYLPDHQGMVKPEAIGDGVPRTLD